MSVLSYNREYRSTIFSLLFDDKDALLSLYNALNDSNYDDADGLTINTLKDGGIFMKFRNDVSFVFCSQLTIIEHQSTVNPNMPLRNLYYVTDLYKNMVTTKQLYKESLTYIPAPRFVVLYNGKEDRPLVETLRLSDAFERIDLSDNKEHELELVVTVYNINLDKDPKLLQKCKPLLDYALLIESMNKAIISAGKKDEERAQALEKVIDECIAEDLLSDFLTRYKSEVVKMYVWEYSFIWRGYRHTKTTARATVPISAEDDTAPSANAAASCLPSAIPPAAMTGIDTASTTCGTSVMVVISPTCPPLSVPSAIIRSAPASSIFCANKTLATTGITRMPCSFHIGIY